MEAKVNSRSGGRASAGSGAATGVRGQASPPAATNPMGKAIVFVEVIIFVPVTIPLFVIVGEVVVEGRGGSRGGKK